MSIKSVLVAAALGVACSVSAKDKVYYVDCQMDDYAGHDGSSWEKAFETIQEAINKCSNDDTIYVKPGLYNKGEGAQVSSWGRARIGWNSKRLYIKSTEGAENTIIEGVRNFDPEQGGTAEGYGENTMHCLAVYHFDDSSKGSVIQGFTFRHGATYETYTAPLQANSIYGGAVCLGTSNFYFADCVFTENTACNNVLYGGSYIRCRITNNNQRKATYTIAGVGDTTPSILYACVIDHNINASVANCKSDTMSVYAAYYNCTFVDNYFGNYMSSGCKAFNCLLWNPGTLPSGANCRNCFSDVNVQSVMSTLFTDVRLIEGCAAQTAGDAANLEETGIPDEVWAKLEYGKTDFNREAFPTEGQMVAGAVQTAVTPQYGGVATYNFSTTVDGVSGKDGAYSYVYATAYPTQFVFSAYVTDPTKRLAYIHFKQGCPGALETYDYRFPDRQDKLVVMPPPTVALMTNDNTSITSIAYTHPDAVAAEADGSRDHPYRTIQAALDDGKTMIVAMAGTYAEGEVVNANSYGRSRIETSKVARITSEEGPEKTIIKGAASTDPTADEYGNGPGAVRCILQNGNMTQFQGFTLTDGHTDLGSGNKTIGGAVFNTSNYLWIDDCIITNNTAKEGIVRGSKVQRSIVAYNYAKDNILISCFLNGSVVEKNDLGTPANGLFGGGCLVIHSTVIMPKTVGFQPWTSTRTDLRRYMSLFIGGDTAYAAGTRCSGNVYSDMMSVLDTTGGVNAKVTLADPENGDFTPFKGSATLTSPQPFTSSNYGSDYWFYARTYFDGTPIAFKNGNTPIAAGAIPGVTDRCIVAVEAALGGIAPANDRIEVTGDSITLTETSCSRPIAGVLVGGVERLFSDGPVMISAEEAQGGILASAIYSNKWYVDANNGNDDTNTGFSPETAKKTLAGVFKNVIPGDVVYAAEGLYNTGTMKAKDEYVIESRVVITNNASLIATGRQSETIIEGEYATTPAEPIAQAYRTTWGMRGIGLGAVKGACLMSGALIKGFTFRNCFADMRVEGKTAGESGEFGSGSHNDNTGGALFADASNGRNNCWAEDCFVTNCGAYRGGGVMGVKCKNCVFVDNLAGYGGGAISDGYAYNCISRDNHAQFPYRNYYSGMFYMVEVDGCTILDGYGAFSDASVIGRKNTLFAGYYGLGNNDNAAGKSWNCAFASDSKYDEEGNMGKEYFTSLIDAHHLVVAPIAELVTDSEGRPIVGANVAIDKADPSISAYVGDKDIYGGPRVTNGALDIGALEANWLPRYSLDLHKRVTTVTAASPMVQEVGDAIKRIQLVDGTTLTVTVAPSRHPFGIPINVQNGLLSLSIDGEEPSAYSGEYTITLDESDVERTLQFSFAATADAGDKLATIGEFKSQAGAAIFLR